MGRSKVRVLHDRVYPSKICPRCKQQLPLTFFANDKSKSDGVTSHCKECRNNHKKAARSAGLYSETEEKYWKGRDPAKDYAKSIVARLIRAGMKKPEECEVCSGKERIEAHHPDYSNPFKFIWLCKRCHAFVGRK